MRNPVSKAINAESMLYLEQFIEAKNILPTQSWASNKRQTDKLMQKLHQEPNFLSRYITRNPKLLISC